MRIFLHLLQAVVFAAAARELAERWWVDAAVLGVAAGAMVVGAVATGLQKQVVVRLSAALALTAVMVVLGRFGAQGLHVYRVFGPVTGEQALSTLGGALLVLPWLVVFPISQLGVRFPAPVVLLGLLPVLEGLRPYPAVAAPADRADFAAQTWRGWNDGALSVSLPEGADVRITPLERGNAGDTVSFAAHKSPSLPPPGPRAALLIEIAVQELPEGHTRPGTDTTRGRSAVLTARSLKRREVVPGLFMPGSSGASRRFESFLASDSGVVQLDRGWAPGPPRSAAAIDAAVRAGADHLLHNLQPDGGFTYIVEGPTGKPGKGYNYPRHAGTSWYLARVAATFETDADGPYGRATDQALGFLDTVSQRLPDGRAYVLDPSRKDGRSWAGTTALAAMAGLVRGRTPALTEAWVKQLAASVDDKGQVRGEMLLSDGTFPVQDQNGYGQGQVVLALAMAERHGVKVGEAALTRAVDFLEADYIGSAHPLVTGDEHWMCLAAHAIVEVRGRDVARGICKAYLASTRFGTPVRDGGVRPAAGPGGGLAEAVIAHAWDTADPVWIERSYRWADLFLDSQYQAADAPMLGAPERLLGGFRDGPGQLDVQIDAVQHIGSALLGAEALLSGRARPGSLP